MMIAIVLLFVACVCNANVQDCKDDQVGEYYMGNVSTTKEGYECKSWSDAPEMYTDDMFPDGSRTAAGARCRNPRGRVRGGPYCYTVDEEKVVDVCDIPRCDGLDTEPDVSKHNLALKKRTMQCETGYKGLASYAVDGHRITSFRTALKDDPFHPIEACTHTFGDSSQCTQAWWAVDLGREHTVTAVKILGRDECCMERLQNFNIGLTNRDPERSAPAPGRYQICAHAPPLLAGEPEGKYQDMTFRCETPLSRRYVIVQLLNEHVELTLCEVEVF
jgi:hypothetical protein